jgi:hypothetical protein
MPGSGTHKIPVVFYRTQGGAEVVRDWLRSLPEVDRQAVGLDLMRVQYRWPVGMPLCRARRWLVGGAHVIAEQPDRSRPVQRAAGPHPGPSRVHQEDPEDPAGRPGPCTSQEP